MDEDYQPVEFRDLLDGCFYFEADVTEPDVHPDVFKKSEQCRTTRIETKQKFLVLKMDNELQAERLTIYESHRPECRFCIQFYSDSSSPVDPGYSPRAGRPVILYTIRDNVKMVVSCNNESNVCVMQKENIEEEINASKNMMVFYMRKMLGSNRYKLESSIYEKKFLGFETVSSSLSRLTLCDDGEDCVVQLSD